MVGFYILVMEINLFLHDDLKDRVIPLEAFYL